MRKRRMWPWTGLLNSVRVPLGVLEFVFFGAAELCEAAGVILSRLRRRWLVRVRLWAGLTADGETPEQVEEKERRRTKALYELERGLEEMRKAGGFYGEREE